MYRMNTLIGLVLCLSWTIAAQAATGGPDAYGYWWVDTDEGTYSPSQAAEFEEQYEEVTLDNDGFVVVGIGFDFEFYGELYGSLTISANGGVHFDGQSGLTPDNESLPYQDLRLIAPWWDDLDPSTSSAVGYTVRGEQPERIFVVRWMSMSHTDLLMSPDPIEDEDSITPGVSFELLLHEADGSLEFIYWNTEFGDTDLDHGASATIGIQDGEQGFSLQHSFNQAALSDGYAILFELTPCADGDGDGFEDEVCGGLDCDDGNPAVYPGATETCDGITDNDCDGVDDPAEIDQDGDGDSACDGDCDDGDPAVGLAAAEDCADGIDNNCDGYIDAYDLDCSVQDGAGDEPAYDTADFGMVCSADPGQLSGVGGVAGVVLSLIALVLSRRRS